MSFQPDREMRCVNCGYRCFTSEAPQLVAQGQRCPRCERWLELAPASPEPSPLLGARHFAYPRVVELAGPGAG
jgi:DNA-directed RNA polymerase subunit RPC12/RpoP